MNRPNLKDYPFTDYHLEQYYKDLEKYCDELENKLERLSKLYSESQNNLMVSDMANRQLSDIINELAERGTR